MAKRAAAGKKGDQGGDKVAGAVAALLLSEPFAFAQVLHLYTQQQPPPPDGPMCQCSGRRAPVDECDVYNEWRQRCSELHKEYQRNYHKRKVAKERGLAAPAKGPRKDPIFATEELKNCEGYRLSRDLRNGRQSSAHAGGVQRNGARGCGWRVFCSTVPVRSVLVLPSGRAAYTADRVWCCFCGNGGAALA